jgi:ABC-type branched-subunit amino acid transport system substrate-binding protein
MKKLALIACASTLALAACGGSDEATADGPILLYQIIPVESQVTSLPFIGTAAQAAVDEINADGGVSGRKLELVTCNDKFDPNEALRCAQKASRDGATAIVGQLSQFGAQFYPVLDKKDIISIGADAVSAEDGKNPVSYLIDPGVPGFAALPSMAKTFMGIDKVAVVDIDNASAPGNLAYYKIGAELSGVEIVDQITVPVDAIDYAQYISQAESSGAGAIITAMPDQGLIKMWKAIKTSGSDIKVLGSGSSIRADVLAEVGDVAEGDYAVSGTPNGDESNEWGKQFVAAMKKYQPQEKVYGSLGLRAYASVHLFAEVAETIEGDITSSSVRKAFDGVHDMPFMWIESLSFDVDGPIEEYPRITNASVFPIEIKDGQLITKEAFDPFA